MPSKKLESMSFVHGTTQQSDILDVLREELFKKINAHNEINATLDRYRMRTECTDWMQLINLFLYIAFYQMFK